MACLAPLVLAGLPSDRRAETLEDALISTYLSNPVLEAERADLRATTERVAEALGGAAREALVGQRITLDLLDLESDLFQAEGDLAGAHRDEIVASYRLGAALSQLTAERLDLPVERYDPKRYHADHRGRWFGLGD